MKVSTILDQIDMGSIALPEFQRGYVWSRSQVRKLMLSLYRKHPVGSLLVWETRTEHAEFRGDGPLQSGTVRLLLDGQQRITTLYGIIRGKPPAFFQGNASAFAGLYFHLEDEAFEFYGPVKMRDDPLWLDVTELMQKGLAAYMPRLVQVAAETDRLQPYVDRLNRITSIQELDLHVEQVTGEDKRVDVVVDIFNEVNSGGTKLSQADLALAKVCASWSDARETMRAKVAKWSKAGYQFKLEWLLRVVNAIATGEARFAALEDAPTESVRDALERAEKAVDTLTNHIASRLGLDHDRVLGSRYSFPLMARLLDQQGGKLGGHAEWDRLLYWYVHTMLWGRYAGSVESTLDSDLAAIEDLDGALDRLIANLSLSRGDLLVRPDNFRDWSRSARFYPLLYMLTRVWHSKDWETGCELAAHTLGSLSRLELHHIFPKSRLYEHGYPKSEVNALANFTFLTQETNLIVGNKHPSEYLAHYAAVDPGLLESHWIPLDPALWEYDRYQDFLSERRALLSKAANDFLGGLLSGSVPQAPAVEAAVTPPIQVAAGPAVGGVASEDEEVELFAASAWLTEQGLPAGELMFELSDPETGDALAVLDLAWPNGLQEGLSEPIALLLDEPVETISRANQAGFRCFTEVESLQEYVVDEILEHEAAAD